MPHFSLNTHDMLVFSFQSKEFPTFKDNDFTRDNVKLYVGEEKKADIIQKIKNDIKVSFGVVLPAFLIPLPVLCYFFHVTFGVTPCCHMLSHVVVTHTQWCRRRGSGGGVPLAVT